MTPEQYARVREVFEEALEVPVDQVKAWLTERCPDAAVRREVASLLDHHSRAGTFLEASAADLAPWLQEGPAEPAGHAPGHTIGPYRIVAEAGRGGMGQVYRAVDVRLDRTVALKAVPASQSTDPSFRERLRREARAAAALVHPGICTVFALDEIDGDLYLVTEFVDGRTLRGEIDEGLPPAERVADVARQLAAALAAAHASGITHRDLKPENVMRTRDGRIKVLDFGLAREKAASGEVAGRSQPTVTQEGLLVGTPAYMAPEQLNGQPADPRTDVFAFGVLIAEYATGRHPFDAPTAIARAGRVMNASPDPLRAARPDLPDALTSAVDRCLQKDPSARFASAVELLAALEQAPATASAAARRPPHTTHATHGRRDRRAPDTGWWRTHQLVMIGLYFTLVCVAWFVKEWHHGLTSPVFLLLGISATIVGVLRAHLVFTERTHGIGLDAERRRVGGMTLVFDLAMAVTIGLEGLLVASRREVAGLLTIALAVGLGLARFVLEPTTTRAAFPADEDREESH